MRIVLGIFFILAAIWLALKGPELLYDLPKHQNKMETSTPPMTQEESGLDLKKRETIDRQVDRHLKDTYYQLQFQKNKMEFELKKEMIRPGENIFGKDAHDSASKPLFSDDEGWRRKTKPFEKPTPTLSQDPNQLILEEMARRQYEEKEREQERAYYIWQFRRNAWYGGYDVRVDPSGRVQSVRPLTDQEKARPFPEER